MSWRRFSLLLLLAACWLAPSRVGPHPARTPAGFPAFRRVAPDVRPEARVTSSPRQAAITPFAPWRYRLKSVLRGFDFRPSQDDDFRPLPSRDLSTSAVARTSRSEPFRSISPMRC